MWLRMTAVAVLAAVPGLCAWAGTPLSLDDAFARVSRQHPALQLIDAEREQLAAEADAAALRPAMQLGLEVENAFGRGELQGLDRAEITLSLAGVLERGGKAQARQALADQRLRALTWQGQAQRLDMLAETARRYLAVCLAQEQLALAGQDIDQRKRTVAAARLRFQAGASPESVLLTAQAALARAELEQDRQRLQLQVARRHLALLWGQADADFDRVSGRMLALPAIADFEQIAAHLRNAPELAQLADRRRIAEARLQLARSERATDVSWQLGVRRLQENGDSGLVASLTVPLGSAARAAPGIRGAQAELGMLEVQREVEAFSLQATLADAHGRYRIAQAEVQALRTQVSPRLQQAERAAERAYRAGALSYLEWAQLQGELAAARRQQHDAAFEAQRALIEIQRLTGQSFVLAAGDAGDTP
ncbi:TolC family protein [Pseudoxanthomonas indica]|uniref:Outer membrane protein, cobalt-zinc-cadmium efflux system n=1 Tax=Pseudoxanthomonas indica TaxID=428993 RepID=A0A1T5KJB7_9GAMM|nr:TolC family protein [Pseudoxanthomonas indica]GGD49648.1 cation efflux system protein [Pseudoxanthomonas indica]SKC63559.1 outer membrane protein, cobalt-zinc-cadmium efflux system [Pseudoxanthomonas indica]